MQVAEAIEQIDKQIAELVKQTEALEKDPANQDTSDAIWRYTPKTRKKLDRLAFEITQLRATKRSLQGNPVSCDGYSGRQTNRRR